METQLAEAVHIIYLVACVVTTLFPIIYMVFAPWSKSWLGRGVVILGWSLAAALDLTLVFHHWDPPVLVQLSITAVVLLLIIAGSVIKSVTVIVIQTKAWRDSRREAR